MSAAIERAVESATPTSPEQGRTTRKAPTKTLHLYWVKHMEAAVELNVEMRSLCGVWTRPARPGHIPDVVDGYRPVPIPRDCKRCLRIYEAALRREWEANQ